MSVLTPPKPSYPVLRGTHSAPGPDNRHPHRRRWGWVVLLLAGFLVLCHGCHLGNHDDELVLLPWLSAPRTP